jgi:putative peptidoglycan lipid II flippase
MTCAQGWLLRRRLGGIDGRRTLAAGLGMLAAAALLAAAAYGAWVGLDGALGRSLPAQIAAVGAAIAAGGAVYAAAVWALRIPEARQVVRLLRPGRAG